MASHLRFGPLPLFSSSDNILQVIDANAQFWNGFSVYTSRKSNDLQRRQATSNRSVESRTQHNRNSMCICDSCTDNIDFEKAMGRSEYTVLTAAKALLFRDYVG